MVRNEGSDKRTKRRNSQQRSSEGSEDRLKSKLRSLGKDAPWLASESGVPVSTVYDTLRRGIGKPAHAASFAAALGVSIDWLLTGKDGRVDGRRAGRGDDELAEVAEIDPNFGLGAVFMDESAAPEMRTFSRTWLRQITTTPPEELYWARGRGNSMAPTIDDGEPVLIDRRQQSPRDADLLWAFAWGDVGAIKRLRPMPDGTVKILSDNPAVPPESAHGSEIHIFGRVVAVVKNL